MGRGARELRALNALQRVVWGADYYDAFYRQRGGGREGSRLGRGLGAVAIAVGAVLVVFGVSPTAAHATRPNPMHKITLCHATNSYSNPYVVITVDVASVLHAGHDGHNGPVFFAAIPKHQKWGDIIPSFNFGPKETYPGKNWNAAGMSVFDNHCTTPSPTTTTTSTTTSTSTSTTVTTTTTVPVTSTTTSSSSTTAPGSSSSTTSTTSPPSTSSSTSSSSTAPTTTVPSTVTTAGGGSTTIPGATTSTTPGEGVLGGPTTTTTASNPTGSLPHTGANTVATILTGLTLIGAGIGLARGRRVRG